MSHFVDTNQHRVCTKCGNRWYSVHVDSKCQKCATERVLGGQILAEEKAADPEPEKKVGSKRAAEKKSAKAHEATSKERKAKEEESDED